MKTQFTEQSERKLLPEFDPSLSKKKMYYTHILKDKKTNKLYYGYTNNLERRFNEHNIKIIKKLFITKPIRRNSMPVIEKDN